MKVKTDGTEIYWDCPSSKCGMHSIPVTRTGEQSKHNWKFNGDVNNPTIEPSILSKSPRRDSLVVCHFYVRSGHVQFLPDCTHELAGKTVEMKECEA